MQKVKIQKKIQHDKLLGNEHPCNNHKGQHMEIGCIQDVSCTNLSQPTL